MYRKILRASHDGVITSLITGKQYETHHTRFRQALAASSRTEHTSALFSHYIPNGWCGTCSVRQRMLWQRQQTSNLQLTKPPANPCWPHHLQPRFPPIYPATLALRRRGHHSEVWRQAGQGMVSHSFPVGHLWAAQSAGRASKVWLCTSDAPMLHWIATWNKRRVALPQWLLLLNSSCIIVNQPPVKHSGQEKGIFGWPWWAISRPKSCLAEANKCSIEVQGIRLCRRDRRMA